MNLIALIKALLNQELKFIAHAQYAKIKLRTYNDLTRFTVEALK